MLQSTADSLLRFLPAGETRLGSNTQSRPSRFAWRQSATPLSRLVPVTTSRSPPRASQRAVICARCNADPTEASSTTSPTPSPLTRSQIVWNCRASRASALETCAHATPRAQIRGYPRHDARRSDTVAWLGGSFFSALNGGSRGEWASPAHRKDRFSFGLTRRAAVRRAPPAG